MTPGLATALVTWWVRAYTRGLPRTIAERRAGEIAADLHDHIAHERARGTSDGGIALAVASRMLRGIAADVSWRSQTISRTKDPTMTRPFKRSLIRVSAVTALILAIPAVGMAAKHDGTDWSVFDFVLATVLLMGTGLLLETAVRHPRSIVLRAGAAAIAVAAIVLGEADDAPGLVGFGCLVILGTVALSFRAAQRSG